MHEEDLRWLANLALGVAFIVMFGGVIFAQYFSPGERCYLLVMSCAVALGFTVAGCWIHYSVWQKIKRTTIKNLGGRR